MSILELKNIKKSYELNGTIVPVLDNINISFKKGEFVSVLGESGCGKSTLMNIIGGMDSVFDGDILVNGNSLKGMKDNALDDYRKSKIGFIFQNFNLISHLSVLDNVTLAMEMIDLSTEERIHRAIELLKEVGLEQHIHKKPNQLSGGQKQRVAIARALANDAEIILADEPTGALDRDTTVQILELLKKIAENGKLIIAVTHSQKVADFGTRVISLEDGLVISDKINKEIVYYNKTEIKCIDMNNAKEEDLVELYNDSHGLNTKNLNLSSCSKLAIRNMKLNFKRNLLVAFGCAIGIISLILMLSIGAGVKHYIMSEINNTANPKVIEISKPNEKNNDSAMPMPMQKVNPFEKIDVEKVKAIENVESVEPVVLKSMSTKLTDIENNKISDIFMLSSINSTTTEANVIEGSLPEEDEIMLSSLTVEDLFNTERYSNVIGKKVLISINDLDEKNQPVLIKKELSISGVYNMDTPLMNVTMAFIDYGVLEKAYTDNDLSLKASQLDVYVNSEDNMDDVRLKLKEMNYEDSQTAQMLTQLNSMLDVLTTLFVGIAGVSLVVSGVMILVVLYISVIERTKEIGVLRAIGARKSDIRNIFIVESALLGLISGVIAIISAYIIGYIGNSFLLKQFGKEIIEINIEYLLIGLVISICISIIAGLIPSNKASKLDPVESLRYE